jgi:hypothetical protein
MVAAGSQVVAIGAKITNSLFAGVAQIGMNTAGYYLRGVAGIENAISPGIIEPLPAPTPFLQTVDNGATPGQLINYVTGAFIQSTAYGALALLKMPVDLLMGNFNALKDDSTDALTMLLGFKTGEIIAKVSDFKLIIKQMTLDAELVAQGVISKSPLEFLKNGPDGLQLNIIKNKVIDPANPTAPPVEVTKILTSDEFAKQNAGALDMAPNGQVFEAVKPDPACFAGDTLVHTSLGLMDIHYVTPGVMVLSRSETTGEIGYRRVVRTFEHFDREVLDLRYVNEDGSHDCLYTTPEHPFWVVGKGWMQAGELQIGMELEICDPEGGTYYADRPGGLKAVLAQELSGIRYKAKVDSLVPRGRFMVHNLEVEEFHTYFVGWMGAWVHNTKGNQTNNTPAGTKNMGPWLLDKVTPDAVPKGVTAAGIDFGIVGENRGMAVVAQHGIDVVQMPNTKANIFARAEPTYNSKGNLEGTTRLSK